MGEGCEEGKEDLVNWEVVSYPENKGAPDVEHVRARNIDLPGK